MKQFTALFTALDESNRTLDKVEALRRYFAQADPADAAWALYFLTGRKLKRAVNTRLLREWMAKRAHLPLWLLEESYEAVGDLAETLALLDPSDAVQCPLALHQLVEDYLKPMAEAEDPRKRQLLFAAWNQMNAQERLVWNKVITGGFRVGVARTLVVRALAQVAGIEPSIMAHRIMGDWQPTAEDFRNLIDPRHESQHPAIPYPFYLAYPFEDEPGALGNREDWQVEWKWDGIRAQLIRRAGEVFLWSRGEEMMTARFPEVRDAAMEALPDGVVLDGELLGWNEDRPLPYGQLQRRIGRKQVTNKIRQEVPVVFMVYDLLEHEAEDIRALPLSERRQRVEALLEANSQSTLLPSPILEQASWQELAEIREESRERGVEGFMLKRLDSPYQVGRVKGDWWKWKIEPLTIDAVLIYAQRGHGKRASLYTDYTFGIWHEGDLVPIAKAYSGLTDAEIRKVDRFVRQNTTDRFGPVRVVKPQLVFELAFEGIQASTRHKSGVALRFPRMARWRQDKPIEEADTLDQVRQLMPAHEQTLESPRNLV